MENNTDNNYKNVLCLTMAQWLINFELYYSIKRKVAKLYCYFLFSYRLLYIWLLLLL